MKSSNVATDFLSASAPPTSNKHLIRWVEKMADLCHPDSIHWVDGSKAEYDAICRKLIASGTFVKLNQKRWPGCYYARSVPGDVARVEDRTFICSFSRAAAGPTNNWEDPYVMRSRLKQLFKGAMQGRTMYVLPFSMGPVGSPMSGIGVELTDSPYVVAQMRTMARIGAPVFAEIDKGEKRVVPCMHSVGMPLKPGEHDVPWPCNETKYIVHFPESREIWSYGSGYGGNALLSKKCYALRIASNIARDEGWMAEHMLILGLEDPSGKVTYMAAAFPSACGKTNLAMMVSALETEGYRVWTVGDDIAWMHVAEDGTLRAINPEAGFFGVAPHTNLKTNPNVMAALSHDAIFTNTALTPDSDIWWEGIGSEPAAGLVNWRGEAWLRESGPAAHPNSRYTVAASQAPSISTHWQDPEGVPISALIFGGRRARVAPLVYEARSWQHGVYMGATMASETTAAATGKVGVTRRDPMAMLPFCGYNMADYFQHWLDMEPRLRRAPKIFYVNWFRRDTNGKFLWPGYGDNVRVLEWMLGRIEGRANAVETPIGFVPAREALDLRGLSISSSAVDELLRVDGAEWGEENEQSGKFFEQFGSRLPREILAEQKALAERLTVGVK